MVRSCSSHCCSCIGRLRGRSLQSSPKLILPSVTRAVLRRNSTDSHRLLSCLYPSPSRPYHHHPGSLTPSDAQRRTIYALSTPPGKGGVAVIRVSGPDASKVWNDLTRPLRVSAVDKAPIPRLAQLRHVVDPLTGEKLDDGLVLFFKGESTRSRFLTGLFIPIQGQNPSPPRMSSNYRFTLVEPCCLRSSEHWPSYRTADQPSQESLLAVPLKAVGWI